MHGVNESWSTFTSSNNTDKHSPWSTASLTRLVQNELFIGFHLMKMFTPTKFVWFPLIAIECKAKCWIYDGSFIVQHIIHVECLSVSAEHIFMQKKYIVNNIPCIIACRLLDWFIMPNKFMFTVSWLETEWLCLLILTWRLQCIFTTVSQLSREFL